MEEVKAREVLYETRNHAIRPYKSNCPTQRNEDGKGVLSSLLSVSGISQLKEKWRDYRNPSKIMKPIFLIISPRGERVAVATGNQITILRKEDDYQEPYGIFTSGNLAIFVHGVWSESHDILGIADDNDVLYFIKANGEEITRVMKRQLETTSAIIGLIPHDSIDACGSCFFIILTADGVLYHIEITQAASISFMHTSNSGLTVKGQFPKDVYCFDYDLERSLLLVIGSAVSTSLTSSGKSGSCSLSLWRKCPNLNLEPLFSFQFEGLYHKPKDYIGQIAYPKVLLSPQRKFVATLDIRGCLHFFVLDKEQCSLSNFAVGERLGLLAINRQDELLNDNVDFTWWSDHIVTLARRSGTVTLLDILTGLKLQENDPAYSMPVLDRVEQLEGRIFVVESKSSEERKSLSDNIGESRGSHHVEQIIEDTCWRLISISERSVPEMYSILISNHKYQEALDFANHHGLDRDEVLKSQWLHSCQGINEINVLLSKIKDHGFVLSECINKVGQTEDAVKALLAYGLNATDQYRFSESEDNQRSQIWDFRLARLQLLQFRDRLETFLGINMGRFSVQEYGKFRVMPLGEVAVTLAESGKIGALNLLFKRHPYSLSPSIMQILAAVPETIPVQTYGQLLPGRSPPVGASLRDEDWVECAEMLTFINSLPENHEMDIQIRTEPIVKQCQGCIWPSINELYKWYMNRARDIDCYSGQLENCLSLVDLACSKGIHELQQFHEDISYLYQLMYSDESDEDICFDISLMEWEQLSDYEKFRMMLKAVKEENVVQKLHEKAIPFMKSRFHDLVPGHQGQSKDFLFSSHKDGSFLVRWLKEIALENKLDICLIVIEEGCRELQGNGFFKDNTEAAECALQCVYLCTVTDRWSTLATILSKIPQNQDTEIYIDGLDKRLTLAKGHIEAGRLLAFYQVPKPMNFCLEAHADEKGVKQILRLMLSKFVRRQPGRSDNDWASMWRDMQCLREKAFPFLDPEYMLTEFCRGLLKAGRFSLASNYLNGTGSVSLALEKAENLVIQAAREFFFSASSLSCSEVWKAKECLNLFPSSKQVKAEADAIEALTVKLPNLGVTLLPMQFRQIRDPMEIVKMAITSQPGAYLHVDELIEVAKLLGLNSSDDISAVEEAIAREAAVAGDLQLAFDVCLLLAKKGHGLIWDLCAAIARGPALENMDISSRKQLLGFALSHCDEESIGELLHAWKDLDMQHQCDTLLMLTRTSSSNFTNQDSSTVSLPVTGIQDIVDLKDCSKLVDEASGDGCESCMNKVKNTLSLVAKNLLVESGIDLEYFLRENGKILSFAAFQLPWLLDLSRKAVNDKKLSDLIPGKPFVSIQAQALITTLSWLVRNGFAPKDNVIASLAKSIIEPPVTEEEDVMGCSFLLNLVDAFSGVEVIEEQLKIRKNYQEICSIMNVGMTYCLLHNFEVECNGPSQRRDLLLRKFKEKHTPLSSDEINEIGAVQSTFWRQWKLKLEEKKRVAEHSRVLEHIIPGVETARFLSGDFNYIETVVLSLAESVKLEKKRIVKDVLKLADTYGLDHTGVLLQYLSSILVSEVWTDNDIMAEISEVKGEITGCASETIKTISTVVYPVIDGCNKQRLSCIYGLLSDCYLQLEEKQSSLAIHQFSPHLPALELAHLYKVIGQECQRVSFIKNLNFKNVAGLDGLNFQSFRSEVCAHINEFNLEHLAKMVQTLTSIYTSSVPEGLMSWQDVYKVYVLGLLTTLQSRARMEFNDRNPEKFQKFISQLEFTYDSSQMYIRLLAPSDALDIMKQYLTVIIPLHDCYESIPDNSTWQDCLITLLNFWVRLTEEMQEIASTESSVEKLGFYPGSLLSCLKVFMRLVMEDIVSPSQSWGTIASYVTIGLIEDFAVDILIFCKAMVFSGCGFGAISEVFSEAISQHDISSTSSGNCESQDILHLYTNILEHILKHLESGSDENQNLYHLLSSLSKLEGQLENLLRVRQFVWERMAQFSDNSQLPSQVRVYVLELMQLIRGRNIKGFSAELQSKVLPWEGWDEFLFTSKRNETTANLGLLDNTDASTQYTSTLVALKSSQLVAAISPSLEITPDDLLNVTTAVSCFLKLCEVSNSNADIDVLLTVLEEWEGFFTEKTHSAETSEAGNNDWNAEDWDEGWESFQEVESFEKEKTESSLGVHPLHVCWMEIFKKLITLSRFNDLLRLVDQSLSKPNGILLDEDGARKLSQVIFEIDCFVALKFGLLLPYNSIQLQCLDVVEERLKRGSISDTVGWDHEFFILVISSKIISTIITKTVYGTTFSYLCYFAGNFCRWCQEAQLSSITEKKKEERVDTQKEVLLLFRRILFPSFISELVKADQQILAGFLVTKYMHTNASLSLINVAEACLRRYLERQLYSLQHDELTLEEMSSCKMLKNKVSLLKGELGNLIQSALALLPTSLR